MYKSRAILLNHAVPYKQITAPQQADKIHPRPCGRRTRESALHGENQLPDEEEADFLCVFGFSEKAKAPPRYPTVTSNET